MAITTSNFKQYMGMEENVSSGIIKKIENSIKPAFNAIASCASNGGPYRIYEKAPSHGKSELANINSTASKVNSEILDPAKYYFQECYYASVAKYPKTAMKLAKLGISLLRGLHYYELPPSKLSPTNWERDWFNYYESSSQTPSPDTVTVNGVVVANNAHGAADLWRTHVINAYGNSVASGPYVKMRDIIINNSSTTELEKFLENKPFGDGGTPVILSGDVNLNAMGAYAEPPIDTYIASATTEGLNILNDLYPNVNEGGIARLTRFLKNVKDHAPSGSSLPANAMNVVRIRDYINTIDSAYNNSKTVATICSNIKTTITVYRTNRRIYTTIKRIRVVEAMRASLERAKTLMVDIAAKANRDIDLYVGERGWMSLSVVSVICNEISNRLANLERIINAVGDREQTALENSQMSKLNDIQNTLSSIASSLSTVSTDVAGLKRETTRLDNRINSVKNSLNNATVNNGEISIEYHDQEPSVLSGLAAYVNTIRTAIYGSDMRAAIANAIENIATSLTTITNNNTALNNLYNGTLQCVLIDTYSEWEALTADQKAANVIYVAVSDRMFIYKSSAQYFTDEYGSKASFGRIISNYDDVSYDISIYGPGILTEDAEGMEVIDLSGGEEDNG